MELSKDDLKRQIYTSVKTKDLDVNRSHLDLIKPYDDIEIDAEFDYIQLDKTAQLLFDKNKEGKAFRKTLKSDVSGFTEFLDQN